MAEGTDLTVPELPRYIWFALVEQTRRLWLSSSSAEVNAHDGHGETPLRFSRKWGREPVSAESVLLLTFKL